MEEMQTVAREKMEMQVDLVIVCRNEFWLGISKQNKNKYATDDKP